MSALLRDSAIYLLARGVPAAISFAALAVYTRILSPEEFGLYALAMTAVTLGNALLFRWLNAGVKRYVFRYRKERGPFLATVATAFGAAVLVATAIAACALLVWPDYAQGDLVWVTLTLLVLWSAIELNLSLRNAQLQPVAFGILAAAKSVLALALGAGLGAIGWGPLGVLAGICVGLLLALLALTARDWTGIRLQFVQTDKLRALMRYGFPLVATFALASFVNVSDRFILWWMKGAEATGLYAAGYDLPNQVLTVLMMTVNLASFPLIVLALEKEGEEAAGRKLKQHAELLLSIGLPGAVAFVLLGDLIAVLVLGPGFRIVGTDLIPLIAVATFLGGVKAYYFDLAFQLGQRTVFQVWILIPVAMLNLVLNLLLIPGYGVRGAAWATVVAYGFGMLISWLLSRRCFKMPLPRMEIGRVVFATCCMALVIWLIREAPGAGLLLCVSTGLLSYLVASLAVDAVGARSLLLSRCATRIGRNS